MNYPIKAFCLNGNVDGEKIEVFIEEIFGFPENTAYDGGYDFKGTVNICVGSYAVNSGIIYSSTGALYRLLTSLKQCYQSLKGTAKLCHSLENDFIFDLKMTKWGHGVIEGEYQEFPDVNNKLTFEMETDQTCILIAINALQYIETLFGNELGKRTKQALDCV